MTPQPRCGIRASFHGETWIEPEEYSYHGAERRALARMLDGSLRVIRCKLADTFFSIPGRTSDGTKGFLSIDTDANEITFRPYPADSELAQKRSKP